MPTEWQSELQKWRGIMAVGSDPLDTLCSTRISEELIDAARSAGLPARAVMVDVNPFDGASPNGCYDNVDEAVRRFGGSHQPGWRVEECKYLYSFTPHDVHLTVEGPLIDVTPLLEDIARIVFIPDPAQPWKGKPVPIRYAARIDTALVRRCAKLYHRLAKLYCDCWLPDLTAGQIYHNSMQARPDLWEALRDAKKNLLAAEERPRR